MSEEKKVVWLDMKEMSKRIGLSVPTVKRLAEEGKLPPFIVLGAHNPASKKYLTRKWAKHVVEEWIDDGCPIPYVPKKSNA